MELKTDITPGDLLVHLAQGNPGASFVCRELLRLGVQVDPDGDTTFGCLLALDNLEIRGSNIYKLWQDICKENTAHVIALLRAEHFGLLPVEEIRRALEGKAYLNAGLFVEEVKKRLPNFNPDVR